MSKFNAEHAPLTQSYLRRLVSGLNGCLSALPRRQAEVLRLRTGLGLRRSYTRREVARLLKVSVQKERRLERTAVVGLTTASARSNCASASTSIGTIVTSAVQALASPFASLPAAGQPSAATGSSSATRAGTSRHGARPHHPRTSTASTPPAPRTVPQSVPSAGSGGYMWLWLILAVLAGLMALWFINHRRQPQADGGWVFFRHRTVDPVAGAGTAAGAAGVERASEPVDGPDPELAEAVAAFELGRGLEPEDGAAVAEEAYRHGDESGHVGAAFNLGVMLAERGDLAGAEEAFRRADARGDATGASNLGVLLAERGDMPGAEQAFRRADDRGHSGGAFNLGVLLAERGELAAAEQAFRRADDRGHPAAPFNLGVLLAERGDLAGAEAAYRRADERGDAGGASNLGVMLAERGDIRAAEAAYRRADRRGHVGASFNLGVLLAERGDTAGAMAAFRRARQGAQPEVAERASAALAELRPGS